MKTQIQKKFSVLKSGGTRSSRQGGLAISTFWEKHKVRWIIVVISLREEPGYNGQVRESDKCTRFCPFHTNNENVTPFNIGYVTGGFCVLKVKFSHHLRRCPLDQGDYGRDC